jgi:two-component system response regulator MprA
MTSAAPANAERVGSQRLPLPGKPILIAEDDDDLREALAYLFETCGYRVVVAADGEQALAQLRSGVEPCMILLDLMMPRKDGFQFRMEQLQDRKLARIPTVAYSGVYRGGALREKAAALGISMVFEKPMDYDVLLDLVEKHCRRGQPQKRGSRN